MIIRSRGTKHYRGRSCSDPPLHPQKCTISPPPLPPHHSQHHTNSAATAPASNGITATTPSSSGPSVAAPPSTARSAAAPPSTARSSPTPYATDDPALGTSSGDGSFVEIDRREVISVEDTSKPRFVPPSVTRYIISTVLTRKSVPTERWKDYPFILKGLLFKDFMDTYRFASECDYAMAKVVWKRTCMNRYPNYLKKGKG